MSKLFDVRALSRKFASDYHCEKSLTFRVALVFYGSWSQCQACGSFDFNDTYFSRRVYQMRETSHSPEAIAAHRRRVPDDPVVHCHGELGVSSRWWYLPGMYKPIVAKCHCCDGAETDGQAGQQ